MPSGSGTLKGAKMRKTYKKVITLCAVLIFALALIPVQSFAIGDPFTAIAVGGLNGASGAGLFGSMASASGLDIGFPSGTSVTASDVLWNDLNPDSVYFSGEKGQVTETDPVTGIPTVYDYISVDIGDWLQAQNDFIDEFVSEYQVTDNDSGNVSVSDSYCGYTFSNYNNGRYYGASVGTVTVGNTYTVGNYSLYIGNSGGNPVFRNRYNGTQFGSYEGYSYMLGQPVFFTKSGNQLGFSTFNASNNMVLMQVSNGGQSDIISGYTSTWSSGTLNTGVFDGYTAAKVKIPASSWSPSDPTNWNVAEFLEELTVKLVAGHSDQIIIEDDSPTPPPVPIPSTPLGDIPTDEWYDLFGLPVLEGQEEIHQDLQDFSSDVSEGIDDVIGELEDIESDVESIDTNLGIGNGLLGDLKTIGQSIQSTLSSILSGVTDLVQEIVLSTETFIAGLLNSIMGGLGGMFSTMREAFSIWHYVVEWVGSISTVFSWFWSVAGSTSYYIQLPIYASLAGAVVLAFYKRFGK